MPTYDYKCSQCGYSCEVIQKITAEPLRTCPQCGQDHFVRGPGGGLGLHFQGSGFYITDYKSTGEPKAEKSTPCHSGSGGCCPCKS